MEYKDTAMEIVGYIYNLATQVGASMFQLRDENLCNLSKEEFDRLNADIAKIDTSINTYWKPKLLEAIGEGRIQK